MIKPRIAQLLLSDPYGSLALVEKDPTSFDAKEILAQWKEGIPVTTIPGGLILRGSSVVGGHAVGSGAVACLPVVPLYIGKRHDDNRGAR